MGWPARRFPYYIGYLEPGTAFGLAYGVNLHRDADDRRHRALGRGRWSARCCSARLQHWWRRSPSLSAVNLP